MKLNKYIAYLFLYGGLCVQCAASLQPHERWWDTNVDSMMPQFTQWFGDMSSLSRIQARRHIKKEQYKTVLDVACSLGTDFWGFQQDGINIAYLGMDVSPKFVELAQSKHIPVIQGNIEDIQCKDSSFEVCYVRHILEHLPYYEKAITELIRIARSEVLIVFFIRPSDSFDSFSVSLDHNSTLYYNCYNTAKLIEFVFNNSKVDSVEWEGVDGNEIILHIYLK